MRKVSRGYGEKVCLLVAALAELLNICLMVFGYTALTNVQFAERANRIFTRRYYMLLSRMLRPLLEQHVPDVATLLRCIKASPCCAGMAWIRHPGKHSGMRPWNLVSADQCSNA